MDSKSTKRIPAVILQNNCHGLLRCCRLLLAVVYCVGLAPLAKAQVGPTGWTCEYTVRATVHNVGPGAAGIRGMQVVPSGSTGAGDRGLGPGESATRDKLLRSRRVLRVPLLPSRNGRLRRVDYQRGRKPGLLNSSPSSSPCVSLPTGQYVRVRCLFPVSFGLLRSTWWATASITRR